MPLSTPFCQKLVEIAEFQHNKYHLIDENDEPLSSQIKKYWLDLGFDFPGVGVPWSAVFISWCVKQAGATKSEFAFAAAHAKFAFAAIANHKANKGVFRGQEITAYAPKVGDIIQNNRLGKKYAYKYAATHDAYQSHSAIVTEIGIDTSGRYALTIGGNESDSVRSKVVRLDENGFIKQREVNSFICVIQNLK